jgi:GR25 family glycosyltransferase involved in LPS biosynthesis
MQQFLETPVLVINLERCKDRLDTVLPRISDAGFKNVSVFRGVDAKSDDPKILEVAWAAHGSPKLDTADEEFCVSYKGKQGCMLSWLNLLKYAIDNELPQFIGFEDDVMFHPRWAELAPEYVKHTPIDFDFVYLGAQIDTHPRMLQAQIAPLPVFCTHAMLFTLAGARKIYDFLLDGGSFPIKSRYVNLRGVRTIDCMLIDMQKLIISDVTGYTRLNPPPFRWYVWNATMYPSKEGRSMDPGWAKRNNGLVFQDDAFESEVRLWG